jgi:hypothetical protein
MAQLCRWMQKPRMRRRSAKCFLSAGGRSAVAFLAATIAAEAQGIEKGNGVVCDSPQHVEQMIALRTDSRTAVEEINTQSNERVCEILNIAFLVGAVVGEASNDKGSWQIRKILIVGIYLGPIMNSVQPYQKYTAFLTSKAAPI